MEAVLKKVSNDDYESYFQMPSTNSDPKVRAVADVVKVAVGSMLGTIRCTPLAAT